MTEAEDYESHRSWFVFTFETGLIADLARDLSWRISAPPTVRCTTCIYLALGAAFAETIELSTTYERKVAEELAGQLLAHNQPAPHASGIAMVTAIDKRVTKLIVHATPIVSADTGTGRRKFWIGRVNDNNGQISTGGKHLQHMSFSHYNAHTECAFGFPPSKQKRSDREQAILEIEADNKCRLHKGYELPAGYADMPRLSMIAHESSGFSRASW